MTDAIHLTRDQLNAWAGIALTDDQIARLKEAIAFSSIPEAIASIVSSFAPQVVNLTDENDVPATPGPLAGLETSEWVGDDGAVVVQVTTSTDLGGRRVRINLNDAPVWDGIPDTDARPGAYLTTDLAASRATVDYTYDDGSQTVGGSWMFDVAPGVDFSSAWENVVRDFRRDPEARLFAKRNGHGLNYGDLITDGHDILARYGLTLVPIGRDKLHVDHDDVLVDLDELCSTPDCPNDLNDSEGWDGKCGTCADRDEAGQQ